MTDEMMITDFSYMDEPERTRCEQLQAKINELLPQRQWTGDSLWQAAADALGNDDERFCHIYICEYCNRIYHGDYSTSSDPLRDFCGGECEMVSR